MAHNSVAAEGGASHEAKALPRLPYGVQQGSFRGVVASSNRDDGFFSGESNYVNGLIYTGYRYQCVEYARRFLLLTTGCIFQNCGRASEIYRMKHITHVETGVTYPLVQHDNGKTKDKPQPGNIIIYPYHKENTPWGHVGIISYVDDHRVGVIEQNQIFHSCVSPHDDYCEGERCVSRFIRLEHDAEGHWRLHDEVEPQCLGWMSYDEAPQRELIYQPLKPLPNQVSVNTTPLNHPDHPVICHYTLPEGIPLPSGVLKDVYGVKNGAGQSLVGASTATARIVRNTLQFLFYRERMCESFLNLPTNPLQAHLKECEPPLASLFETLAHLGTRTDCYDELIPTLSTYFALPEAWLRAMQREFSRGEVHMCAAASFTFNIASDEERAALPLDERYADVSHYVEVWPAANPHDECWCLAKVDFGTPQILMEVSHVNSVAEQISTAISVLEKNGTIYPTTTFNCDFSLYLKSVEVVLGPRTAFTIAVTPDMSGPQRDMVSLLQDYCERVKYPVRVVTESDLHYDPDTAKLYARPTEVSPEASSPNAVNPTGEYEVNFVLSIAEWEDILHDEAGHAALHAAALDGRADVVFAKPLWSYLCSGVVNRAAGGAAATTAIRFFDIARRLYELALPKQMAETWDQEISEYKDSCRRVHLSALVPQDPPEHLAVTGIIINFAQSARAAHVGGRITDDQPVNTSHGWRSAVAGYVWEESSSSDSD